MISHTSSPSLKWNASMLLLPSHFSLSDFVWPRRQQPTRLPRPWDSPGKNPGVGCHFLLQCMKVKSQSEVAQSCPTLSNPMDCSPPGSSVHGIFQARVLEWVAIAFSNESMGLAQKFVWGFSITSYQNPNFMANPILIINYFLIKIKVY